MKCFWSSAAAVSVLVKVCKSDEEAGRQARLASSQFSKHKGFQVETFKGCFGGSLENLKIGKIPPKQRNCENQSEKPESNFSLGLLCLKHTELCMGGVGNRGGGRGFDLTQTPIFHHFPNTQTHKRTRTHRHADTWTHRHTDKTPQFSLKCEKCEENFWNTQFRLWPNTCVYYTHSALFSHFHINSSSTIFSDF